jgi:hypothetical protein
VVCTSAGRGVQRFQIPVCGQRPVHDAAPRSTCADQRSKPEGWASVLKRRRGEIRCLISTSTMRP